MITFLDIAASQEAFTDDGNLTTISIRLVATLVLFLAGLFLLFCGIKVKGVIYMNESLQRTKFYDKYVKIVRAYCFILPVVFTIALALGARSFYTEYLFESAAYPTEAQLISAQSSYNLATAGIILDIAAVAVMIFHAVYLTGKYGQDGNNESLKGDHPAFRK